MFPSSSPLSFLFFFFRAGRSILIKKKKKKSPAFIILVSPTTAAYFLSDNDRHCEKSIKKLKKRITRSSSFERAKENIQESRRDSPIASN